MVLKNLKISLMGFHHLVIKKKEVLGVLIEGINLI